MSLLVPAGELWGLMVHGLPWVPSSCDVLAVCALKLKAMLPSEPHLWKPRPDVCVEGATMENGVEFFLEMAL